MGRPDWRHSPRDHAILFPIRPAMTLPRSTRSTRLLLLIFIVGCTSESARESAQAPPVSADAESDITPSPSRAPTALPVPSSDVITLASGGLFMPGATFGLDGGGLL